MSKQKIKSISSLILCIIFSLFSSEPALAATLGLSLSPPLVQATVKPGKTISQVFLLQNLSSSTQTFIARIIPFGPGSDGQPQLKPNIKPEWLKYFSLANRDINLNEPFSLENGQTQQLILSLYIPNQANSGDIYATLLINNVLGTSSDSTDTSSFSTAIGSNLLITTSSFDHPPTLIKVLDFYPRTNPFLFRLGDFYLADNLTPITFFAQAQNLGKYFTQTVGTLKIGREDKPLANLNLLPLNLLANSTRVLAASSSGEIIFYPTITHIGQFLASLDIRSENGSSHAEIILILLPIKFGLALIILMTIVLFINRVINSKKNESHQHQ